MTFLNLVNVRGTTVLIHREGHSIPCPCRTPEGYRDPEWHKAHPDQPECNEAGYLDEPNEFTVKAFMQPAGGGRRGMNNITQMFGEVRTDDFIGIFPAVWQGQALDFENWSQAGDEFIEWQGKRFLPVGYSLIPEPSDNSIAHHYECALRRIQKTSLKPVGATF